MNQITIINRPELMVYHSQCIKYYIDFTGTISSNSFDFLYYDYIPILLLPLPAGLQGGVDPQIESVGDSAG